MILLGICLLTSTALSVSTVRSHEDKPKCVFTIGAECRAIEWGGERYVVESAAQQNRRAAVRASTREERLYTAVAYRTAAMMLRDSEVGKSESFAFSLWLDEQAEFLEESL